MESTDSVKKRTSTAAKTSANKKTQVQPKVFWKGNFEFRHDLFKLEAAEAKKNISYHSQRAIIEPVHHCHFYHSHTSTGKMQENCASVAGHFHRVSVSVDADGNFVSECGPPLRKIKKKLSTGKTKTLVERVKFYDEEKGEIVDDHVHEVTYKGSEILSPAKVRQMQQDNREKIGNLTSGQRNHNEQQAAQQTQNQEQSVLQGTVGFDD